MTMLADKGVDLTTTVTADPIRAVINDMCLAPSGGNVQPWDIYTYDNTIDLWLNRDRSSNMDVQNRGSLVAAGAAMYNGRISRNYHSVGGDLLPFPDSDPDLLFRIRLGGRGRGRTLESHYNAMRRRVTNRRVGTVRSFDPNDVDLLQRDATDSGAQLRIISDRDAVAEIADVLAESDRIRYMDPELCRQMLSELVSDDLGMGIGTGTLELSSADLLKLNIVRHTQALEALRSNQMTNDAVLGTALGNPTRKRVNASSGVAVLTVEGDTPMHYLSGGYALEKVWVRACQLGYGVQPVSPVPLYARSLDDLRFQSSLYYRELVAVQKRFNQAVGITDAEAPILVLRLSHDVRRPSGRSLRLPQTRLVHDGPRKR